jgi:hypothetical protein
VHQHPEVLEALKYGPRLKPVWLPTSPPWLNTIEKLWRWLRQSVLKMHCLADDWPALKAQVRGFLDQFATGSTQLLHYVGQRGEGKPAHDLVLP